MSKIAYPAHIFGGPITPHMVVEILAGNVTDACACFDAFQGITLPVTVQTGPGIITHNIAGVCMHLCQHKQYGVLVFNPNNNVYYPYGQESFIEAVCQAVDLGLAMVDPKA